MFLKKLCCLVVLVCLYTHTIVAQDSTDIMNQIETAATTTYTTATFKTTRLITGQSVENLSAGVLDVRINHRFGALNSGLYNLFGLDNASMRMGFDYGITNNVMVGIGRSTYQKTFDAFIKIKILRQSTGAVNMPITLSYVPNIAVNSLKQFTTPKPAFGNRVSYVQQLIIGRKMSKNLSLQIMPTFIHHDNISFTHTKQNSFVIGVGGRQKISKRVTINAEYYYQLESTKSPNATNVLSLGFDIETGGHVFQLHFTNSAGMTEKSFISETTGRWDKGDILFGFNISRVFTIKKRKL